MNKKDGQAAEQRVLRKYALLHKALMEVVASLQYLEPLGAFVDEAEFSRGKNGHMRVQYKARPTQFGDRRK